MINPTEEPLDSEVTVVLAVGVQDCGVPAAGFQGQSITLTRALAVVYKLGIKVRSMREASSIEGDSTWPGP
jgi:hypothetical protein